MSVRVKDLSFFKVYARFLWQRPWSLFGYFSFLTLGQIAFFAQSFVGKFFFDSLTNKHTEIAFRYVILFISIRFLSKLCSRGWSIFDRKIMPPVSLDLEEYALQRILRQSYTFFTDVPSGAALTKIRQLAGSFDRLFSGIPIWFSFFSSLIFTGTLLLRQGWLACILAGGYLFCLMSFVIYAERRGKPLERARSEYRSKAVGVEADILTQSITVLLFGGQKREVKHFHERLQDFYDHWKPRWHHNQLVSSVIDALSLVFECSVLYLLFTRWQAGLITVGDVVLYQGLIGTVIGSMIQFSGQLRQFNDATTEAEEAMSLLDKQPEIQDKPRASSLRLKRGEIRFDHVSFNYNNHPLLQDFSLTIQGRERIALVGRSGAGKSTIIKLLLRCHDPKEGRILIDGQAIVDVKQQSLREQIGFVPQEPLLFHRSLRENIAYGKPDATNAEIIRAAKQAHCHEFISRLPNAYDTLVGERGIKLSGGERQRVAIARAILKNAPILLLDEATSSLDPESEQLIQAAMEDLMKQKTVIVIAHRLSTIRHMDRVVVLDQGKIIDEGTHETLIKSDSLYADFWVRQTQTA